GVGRVGSRHGLAVLGDGALAFQDLHDDRAGGHEFAEVLEERPLLVDAVERLGLLLAHPDATLGHDAQALLLEPGVDLAGQVPAGRVRLDDRESAFDGHKSLFSVCFQRVGAPYRREVPHRQAGWIEAFRVLNAAAPCCTSTTYPSVTASASCSIALRRPFPTAGRSAWSAVMARANRRCCACSRA